MYNLRFFLPYLFFLYNKFITAGRTMTIKDRQQIIKQKLLGLNMSPGELMGFLVISNEQLRKYATGRPYFEEGTYLSFLAFLGIDKSAIGFVDPKLEKPLNTPVSLLLPPKSVKNQYFKAVNHVFSNLFIRTNKNYRDEMFKKHLFEKNFGYTEPVLYKTVLFAIIILFGISYFISELIVLENVLISLSIPLTLLLLVYEFDKHEQLNLKETLFLFVVGGMVSLGVTYLIRGITGYPNYLLGDIVTGFVEETAKLITSILLIRKIKFRNVYTAFVLGFAVGAGFDAFETMEYGLNTLITTGSYYEGLWTLLVRTALSFGIGHHYWTAIIFASLVGLSKTHRIDYHKLYHPTFIAIYIFISLFHAFFNYSNFVFQIIMTIFGVLVFPYIGYQLYLKRFTEVSLNTNIFETTEEVFLPN